MHPRPIRSIVSARRNNPWFMALFLCVYAAIMAFVIFS